MDDKEKELAGTENSTDSTARGNGGSDEYEKICYVCRRPESKAGPMITMPGGMSLCHDCMQKAFDSVTTERPGPVQASEYALHELKS